MRANGQDCATKRRAPSTEVLIGLAGTLRNGSSRLSFPVHARVMRLAAPYKFALESKLALIASSTLRSSASRGGSPRSRLRVSRYLFHAFRDSGDSVRREAGSGESMLRAM